MSQNVSLLNQREGASTEFGKIASVYAVDKVCQMSMDIASTVRVHAQGKKRLIDLHMSTFAHYQKDQEDHLTIMVVDCNENYFKLIQNLIVY